MGKLCSTNGRDASRISVRMPEVNSHGGDLDVDGKITSRSRSDYRRGFGFTEHF
jgi:hypothetical protein